MVLAYFPSGTAKHAHQAIKAGKKAFESWGKSHDKERVEFCRIVIDIMNRRKFELSQHGFLMEMVRIDTKRYVISMRLSILLDIILKRWKRIMAL